MKRTRLGKVLKALGVIHAHPVVESPLTDALHTHLENLDDRLENALNKLRNQVERRTGQSEVLPFRRRKSDN